MSRIRGILVLLVVCLIPLTAQAQFLQMSSINTTNAHRIDMDDYQAGILDNNNLLLYDMSNYLNPVFQGSLPLIGTPTGLDVAGSYVYVAAADSGLLIIDISNPSQPLDVGRFAGEFLVLDVAVKDTICYLMEMGQVTMVDVANPSMPVEVAHLDVVSVHNEAMALGDSMLYVVGDAGEFEFIFGIDISNPAAPYRRAYGFDFWDVSDMCIMDNRLFVANEQWNYLNSYSIADPDSIIWLSSRIMPSLTAISPFEGYLFAVQSYGNLSVIDCLHADTSIVFDSIATPGTPRDIASFGALSFIADSSSIQIFMYVGDKTNDDVTLPQAPAILSNYPDPFNAQTTISFSLDQSGPVTLEVYDLLGRRVASLIEGSMLAGEHQVVWDARNRASGAYYLSLKAGKQSATLRMTLLK
jgi:hypothetical protein